MRTPREFQGGFVVFKVRLKDGSTISCSATLKGKVYVLHFHFVSGTLDLIRQGLVCFKSKERSLHLGSFSFSSSLPFSSSSSPTFKVLADLKSNMALWQKCKSIGNSFFLKQDPSLSSPFDHFSLLKNLNIRNQDPTPPLECGDGVPGVDRGGLRVVIVIVVVIMVIVIIIVVIKVILKRKVCQGEVCVMVLKEHS